MTFKGLNCYKFLKSTDVIVNVSYFDSRQICNERDVIERDWVVSIFHGIIFSFNFPSDIFCDFVAF